MSFTFSDMFAGIGGMRLAFEKLGGKCVLTSENNPEALKTYMLNFPENINHELFPNATHELHKDITTLAETLKLIPFIRNAVDF